MKDKYKTKEQLVNELAEMRQRVAELEEFGTRAEKSHNAIEPENPHLVDSKYSIKDLVDLERLRKILEKFSQATGFTTGLVEYPTQELLIATGWRDICAEFHRAYPESAKHCKESNAYLMERLKGLKEISIKPCGSGLVDGATPIIVKGKHIASLGTGQVLFEKPNIERFRRQAEIYDYDLDAYLEALSKVPVIPEERFKKALSFLSEIACVIAELGLHNLESQESAQRLRGEIVERKRAEEERERLLARIQEQARQVQQIIVTVPEGVLLMDANGRVMLANPAAKKDLIFLANAKVGDTLTHLGDRPLAELLTSPPTKGLWHEVKANGQTFEVIARPMENGPEPEDWVLVINDVTQEREIQRRIQQQERLAAVGQLAAGIAHDFNNIMASIVLYAQMTERVESLPDHVRERMTAIDQQAQHATKLIQQILDFGRRAVLERCPLDLLPLLKEQIKLLERTLPENIKIDLVYGWDEHATLFIVNADPTRMQQMMTNLAVNARDAMPEGGSLSIGLERIRIENHEIPPLPEMETGEWVLVTVSDTGVGIPPDVLPRIYEPFFTTKAPGKGSGLGLAQVHGIVAQHKGHIDVETHPSQGTTFTIYLPALSVHPSESSAGELLGELAVLTEGQEETILMVEDNATTRKALVESLKLLNYKVLEAANGQEALSVLEQHGESIALVLSDVVMPGMGGIALFRTLREKYPQIPIVLLTGHPMKDELESLRAQGLSGWLFKPPDLDQLAEILARVLREGQVHSC